MRRALLVAGGLVLLLPAVRGGEDSPKAGEEIRAVLAEYNKASQEFIKAYREAKTPEERKDALGKRPDAGAYAAKLLALAAKNPKDPASGQALVWITTNAPYSKEAGGALGHLIEHHAKNPAISTALDRLAFSSDGRIDKFFEQVAQENPDPKAKSTAAAFRPFLVGKVAPDIVGEDTDGKKFALSEYRGKVVLLDFWGHW